MQYSCPTDFSPTFPFLVPRIWFLWAMAAHREMKERQFGVVNMQVDLIRATLVSKLARRNSRPCRLQTQPSEFFRQL
jgi:hypothetical protein